MTDGVQLLFFSVLGLAGQVVAVGGALMAFRLGARIERRRLPSASPVTDGVFPATQPTAANAPPTGGLDARSVALLRCLRLPQVTDQAALLAWYSRLQLDGAALAAALPPDIQAGFQKALNAIRDILETPNLDDRYELLAAALLPVYESLHAEPTGAPTSAAVNRTVAVAAPGSANGSAVTSGPATPVAAYRETPTPVSEKDRLAALFEQVEAVARVNGLSASAPAGAPPGEAMRTTHGTPAATKANAEPLHHVSPSQLDTSRLSRRLAEILKTAERNDQPSEPKAEETPTAEPSAPDLHLVTPPLKSRLKRSSKLTPEQEISRKAAHVVGRAREWYGRPDITLREVQLACEAFGLEFNEVAARAELAKPLAEEAS
ncbi:MAG: hypothetical protein NZ585_13615 [Chloracidobacterium sp.]|nr:hypothetical protein [Chloracidobacterium sp.]MDW8218874.1 hypothetical protein [Acidobacteriota bacterium]